MPVDDIPVHALVRKTKTTEHCHNNFPERKAGYWAQDGWHDHRPVDPHGVYPPYRTPRWVWIESSPTNGTCLANHGVKPIKTCKGCEYAD